jgi:hypothetical protein
MIFFWKKKESLKKVATHEHRYILLFPPHLRMSAPTTTITPTVGKERIEFAYLNLVGRQVQVTKRNGTRVDGVLSVLGPEELSMRYVVHVAGQAPETPLVYRSVSTMLWKDVESLVALQAGGESGHGFDPEEMPPASKFQSPRSVNPKTQQRKVFETDRAIAEKSKSGGGGGPRELEQVHSNWLGASTAPPPPSSSSSSSGTTTTDSTKKWNQFKVNEEKFGAKPRAYNPEKYTTELHLNKFTPEQLKQAEKMEKEIETKSSSSSRGGDEPVTGDEESKFAGVRSKKVVETGGGGGGGGTYANMVKKKPANSAAIVATTTPPTSSPAVPPPTTTTATPPVETKPSTIKPPFVGDSKSSSSSSKTALAAKKREEEIRGFKEFSQTYVVIAAGCWLFSLSHTLPNTLTHRYQSPSNGPKQRKSTPPPTLQLETTPAVVVAPAPAPAPAPPPEKKKLNPNAKQFVMPTTMPVLPPPPPPSTSSSFLPPPPPPLLYPRPPMYYPVMPPPNYYAPPPPPQFMMYPGGGPPRPMMYFQPPPPHYPAAAMMPPNFVPLGVPHLPPPVAPAAAAVAVSTDAVVVKKEGEEKKVLS